jgi:transcription initiation factor TFIIIB Brf1 subunit/transcription initiation factor TFIIB
MCDCGDSGSDVVVDYSTGDAVCVRCGVVVEGHAFLYDDMHVDDARRSYDMHAHFRHAPWVLADRDDRDPLADILADINLFVGRLGLSTDSSAAAWARDLARDMNTAHMPDAAAPAKPPRGDARRVHAAAAVYFGCKMSGAARELRRVAAACDVDPPALNDAIATFKERLEARPYHARLFEAVQAGMLINMYAGWLDVSEHQRRAIKRAAHMLDEQLLASLDCSRAPRTICSAVLWLAAARAGVALSKRTVAGACGVCVQSIEKCLADIHEAMA